MKLTRIPGHEQTEKQSWALKLSTMSQLRAYHEAYKAATGSDVSLKDVVEQMLLDFMADDKEFQKTLKNLTQKPASSPAPVAPAALSAQPQSQLQVGLGASESFGDGSDA